MVLLLFGVVRLGPVCRFVVLSMLSINNYSLIPAVFDVRSIRGWHDASGIRLVDEERFPPSQCNALDREVGPSGSIFNFNHYIGPVRFCWGAWKPLRIWL